MKYRDRNNNEYCAETTQDKFLRRLYGNETAARLFEKLAQSRFTDVAGWFLNTKLSCVFIDSFIRKNNIRMSDYKKKRYKSFNSFFIRKLRDGRRKIDENPEVLISPADGKVTAYRISDNLILNIKNVDYSVKALVRSDELAHEYEGGYCVVVRLSVENYHRFHYVDNGYKSENYYIPGFFYTVNPSALEHRAVLAQNSREFTIIETEHFGTVVQMEVGALCVGRIVNHHGEGCVKRGAEKGFFEFGGSTVVLLLKRDSVSIDDDILKNTDEGCETLVRFGEHIGHSK